MFSYETLSPGQVDILVLPTDTKLYANVASELYLPH